MFFKNTPSFMQFMLRFFVVLVIAIINIAIGWTRRKKVVIILLVALSLFLIIQQYAAWVEKQSAAEKEAERDRKAEGHQNLSSQQHQEVMKALKVLIDRGKVAPLTAAERIRYVYLVNRNTLYNLYNTRRSSYSSLEESEKKTFPKHLREQIATQKKIMEDVYASNISVDFVRSMRAVCKYLAKRGDICSEGLEPEQDFTLWNVIEHMYYPEWPSRARAAYLLRNVTEEQIKNDENKKGWRDIFEALIHVIGKNEPSLIVSKTALDTYKELSGFKTSFVFDFDGAIEHWKENGKAILKDKGLSEEDLEE